MLLLRAYKDSGFGGNITAVHFDHATRRAEDGVSPSNKDDADLVLRSSPCPVAVKKWPFPEPMTPTTASKWRRDELSGYDVVVTGHHADDGIESQILKVRRPLVL